MNTKQLLMTVMMMAATGVLAGCTLVGPQTAGTSASPSTAAQSSSTEQPSRVAAGKCQPGPVTITGYGDPGRRLSNCFVEYPGEPSRQDKSYYVVEDVCGQFTKEFIANALGKPIVKTVPPEHDSLFNCRYYLDDQDNHVLLVFEYLKIATQEKGQKEMGRRVEVSDKIPMRNLVVWQPDGQLNTIYLVLGDDKFISIHRGSASPLTADELITFAGNIAQQIKAYK